MEDKRSNKNEKPKKPKAHKLLILISLAVGVLLGILIDSVPFISKIFELRIWEMAILCASVIVIYLFQIALHEAGHLVFGLISGYKFSSYRFLSIMVHKKDGRIKLSKFSVPGTAGQCLMLPPEMKDGKIPVFLYNIGGVVFNLISVILMVVIMIIFRDIPLVAGIMLFGGMAALAMALLNGIPIKTDLVANDGYNALSLSKDPEAIRSFYYQMKINAETAEGTRLRDMPSEWFYIPSSDGMKNSLVASMAVILHSRLMDEHRFYEARELAILLLEGENNIIGLHRGILMTEKLFLDLYLGKDTEDSVKMLTDPDMERFMRLMATSPSTKRVNYTLALLMHKNEELADVALSEFEKVAKSYPYIQEIEGEREIMALVKEKYDGKSGEINIPEENPEQ
ncbi:MAG: hypothetical protein IJW61_02115 [Clostridia bacterium]|nr:hypothetical protein [Clostridia bacterium]